MAVDNLPPLTDEEFAILQGFPAFVRSSKTSANMQKLANHIEKAVAELRRHRATLPCGHPAGCVRGETTLYCGWCADMVRQAVVAIHQEKLPCGHPAGCVGDDGSCGWCKDAADAEIYRYSLRAKG